MVLSVDSEPIQLISSPAPAPWAAVNLTPLETLIIIDLLYGCQSEWTCVQLLEKALYLKRGVLVLGITVV